MRELGREVFVSRLKISVCVSNQVYIDQFNFAFPSTTASEVLKRRLRVIIPLARKVETCPSTGP